MEIWPNFFIVGASRAGTTSLYNFLKRTKKVYMSPEKEPHYFSKTKNSYYKFPEPPVSKKKYLSFFENVKNEKAIGEASTTYLAEPTTAQAIYDALPHAKIIISVRDPVQRSYSFYLLRVTGGKTYSFSEAIKKSLEADRDYYYGVITNSGWYYQQVKRYLDLFGPEQVKIIIFEEFIKNPKKIVKEVLEFLDVYSEPPESVELVHNILTQPRGKLSLSLLQNEKIRQLGRKLLSKDMAEIIVRKVLGKEISKPKMLKKDRIFLENLYRDDVKNLQKLLGRRLLWSWIDQDEVKNSD